MPRRVVLLCVVLSCVFSWAPPCRAAAPPRAEWPAPTADEAGVLRPAAWLGIARVDATGRRPFRPDAVLREHVLPGRSPRAGGTLVGELAEHQTWERREAEANGGPGGGVGWAYTALNLDAPRVVRARVSGASTLWVNGEAFAGDVYRFGNDGVPVSLLAGRNDVYVTGIRGAFGLALHPVDGPLTLGARDLTVPDLVVGGGDVGPLGLLVLNTSTGTSASLRVTAPGDALFAPLDHTVRGLGPLGMRKLHVPLALRADTVVPDDGLDAWTRLVRVSDPRTGASVEHTLTFRIVSPTAPRRVTFRSAVDGSAQFWALRPLDPDADDGGHNWPEHLVLSTHGAGVDALAQARCYAPRPDRWVAAPTNRRPFGFDWQDWGRLDAYEVLDEALALTGVDRRRVAVSGHSMGGHGAWHLAANDADGFSAVAPSAGWESFDSYGGRPDGELADLWQTADQPSRTLSLKGNLVRMPVFVLHGESDNNVPASEGRAMLAALREAGGEPRSHFEPGKGHWWDGPASPGTDCLDWPELAELLATSAIPDDPDELWFTSARPDVDDQHHWLRIEQVESRGLPLTGAEASWSDDDRLVLQPGNVRRLEILPRPGRQLLELVIEEELHGVRRERFVVADMPPGRSTLEGHWLREDRRERDPVSGHVTYERGRWRPSGPPPADELSVARSGPFKRAFDSDFVLVPGTLGDPAESRALAAHARYDAQVWWYRGNGRGLVVPDVDFLAGDFAGRNVLLYGNADTNAAWRTLLGRDAPLDARRGALEIGQDWIVTRGEISSTDGPGGELRGDDLCGLWIRPRADDDRGLVGVFADTGLAGARASLALPTFVSGVGFPDWTLFDASVLERGDLGIQAAGWYAHDWSLEPAVPFDRPREVWSASWR